MRKNSLLKKYCPKKDQLGHYKSNEEGYHRLTAALAWLYQQYHKTDRESTEDDHQRRDHFDRTNATGMALKENGQRPETHHLFRIDSFATVRTKK